MISPNNPKLMVLLTAIAMFVLFVLPIAEASAHGAW
jgi:hypothetical protein